MNGWTFLLSCLMTGGSVLTMAGIWKDSIGHFYIPVLIAAAGIICSMLVHQLKDKYRLSALILLIPWPAALGLTGFHGYFSGLKAWINLVITQWNKVHEDGVALLSGNIVQHDLWASTVIIALLCGEVTYFLILVRQYWLCALYCILWVLIQLFSGAFSPIACIGLFVPTAAVYISNKRTEMTRRGFLWIVGLTVVLAVCAVTVPQQDMLSMAKAKSALELSIRNMRYGHPTLPEGHVDEAARLKSDENEMFTVTSQQEKTLYLKGYTGGRYVDGCWKPLTNAAYGGEYSGMLKWLAKLNFHPLMQAAEYYTLSDTSQEDIPETNELQINVAEAYRYPVYAPASLYQVQGRHAKQKKDMEMVSKGIIGARHYTLDEISNSKPSELMIAQDWVSNPENEAQEQYVQAEAVYREFVYKHYLTVDDDLEETVQHIFWDDYDETNDGIYSAVCQIRNKLEGTVFYTYEPETPPEGEDPILWFLTQSHEGNAVLYASAAVEALRAHGIPARYAEGYYVADTDFQKSGDGSAAVTGLNAHAWVEIYFDGIGWLPVDVTPGYYYDTVTLRQMISTSNVIRKTAAVDDDPNRADPLSTEGGQGSGQSSKAVEVVKDAAAIILGAAAVLILLVIFLIIVLELCRVFSIRKKKAYLKNASQEEAVIEIEKRIFLMLKLRGIDARLGWETEKTDQCLTKRFEWAEPGDYIRVCSILEKSVYGGCELEAYEMRTLHYFLERITAAGANEDWRMRIKMRYACMMDTAHAEV